MLANLLRMRIIKKEVGIVKRELRKVVKSWKLEREKGGSATYLARLDINNPQRRTICTLEMEDKLLLQEKKEKQSNHRVED